MKPSHQEVGGLSRSHMAGLGGSRTGTQRKGLLSLDLFPQHTARLRSGMNKPLPRRGWGWAGGCTRGLISSCWECTTGAPSPSSQGARRQATRRLVNCAPCRRRLSQHLKHIAVQQGEDSEHRGLGRKKLARPGCSSLGVEQHLLIVSFPP